MGMMLLTSPCCHGSEAGLGDALAMATGIGRVWLCRFRLQESQFFSPSVRSSDGRGIKARLTVLEMKCPRCFGPGSGRRFEKLRFSPRKRAELFLMPTAVWFPLPVPREDFSFAPAYLALLNAAYNQPGPALQVLINPILIFSPSEEEPNSPER